MSHLRSDNLRSAELSRVEIDWIVRILRRLPSGPKSSGDCSAMEGEARPTEPMAIHRGAAPRHPAQEEVPAYRRCGVEDEAQARAKAARTDTD